MIDYRAAWEQATAERDEARAERDELLAEIALELHMTMGEVLERIGDYREASAAARRYREALERIAERPCQAPDEHPSKVGECPDYWAIGMSKEACPPCIARQALSDPEAK